MSGRWAVVPPVVGPAPGAGASVDGPGRVRPTRATPIPEPALEEPAVSTTGRGRGNDEDESPTAPPIPSFASLRAPRRTHAALDVLLPPAADQDDPVAAPLPFPAEDEVDAASVPTTRPAPAAPPRPAEWPDLFWFGVRAASAALRLPGALVREPARRLLRLLGE